MLYKILIFGALNFGALALGGLFTSKGVSSEWYANLNKAPWTPPGWAFGAAWTTIMICFTFYMAFAFDSFQNSEKLLVLFSLQWILNVLWNPTFFYYHNILLGLIVISLLSILLGYFLLNISFDQNLIKLLVLPYFLWLLIATSLNAYILLNN